MASDYGLAFGFRRSDESVRVSEGRFRTPKDGALLLLGTAVTIDPANKGFLKPAPASAAPVTGVTGLLVQEEFDFSIYESSINDSYAPSRGVAKAGRLSVITNGPGVKVWFRNRPAKAGRQAPAINIVNLTGVAVGDKLGWNGTQFVKTTTAGQEWMTVTEVNTDAGYCEGVLVK